MVNRTQTLIFLPNGYVMDIKCYLVGIVITQLRKRSLVTI